MKKIFGLLFISLASTVFAGGQITGQIKTIAIDRTYVSPKAFVQVTGDKENSPSCHTNSSWSFALPLETDEDRAVYSLLLSAHATGKTAQLEGRGLCEVHSSIETLTYLKH